MLCSNFLTSGGAESSVQELVSFLTVFSVFSSDFSGTFFCLLAASSSSSSSAFVIYSNFFWFSLIFLASSFILSSLIFCSSLVIGGARWGFKVSYIFFSIFYLVWCLIVLSLSSFFFYAGVSLSLSSSFSSCLSFSFKALIV